MRQQFSGAYNCNGNSQCLNYNLDTVICPSAKASRNWLYSPKGRSAVLREWLNQLAAKGYFTIDKEDSFGFEKAEDNINDFSHQVYDSLDKCLGCKACITGCPIKVDIPTRISSEERELLLQVAELTGDRTSKGEGFLGGIFNR